MQLLGVCDLRVVIFFFFIHELHYRCNNFKNLNGKNYMLTIKLCIEECLDGG